MAHYHIDSYVSKARRRGQAIGEHVISATNQKHHDQGSVIKLPMQSRVFIGVFIIRRSSGAAGGSDSKVRPTFFRTVACCTSVFGLHRALAAPPRRGQSSAPGTGQQRVEVFLGPWTSGEIFRSVAAGGRLMDSLLQVLLALLFMHVVQYEQDRLPLLAR
jgi:hypothetical protein